ncbi:protein kinase family protein [Rhodococcus daqingensis]|uniref:Protein kinase family protein n=1 Tax=Rhodococcus daqingensis TaxID=2479363 RepID=A0ABW2S4X2_9NOCA
MRADTERLPIVAATPPAPARPTVTGCVAPSGRMPGSTFAVGRYRLLSCCGTAPSVEFWRGLDLVTGREVGLTLLGADTNQQVDTDEVFARTVWMCGIRTSAVARIVDMVDAESAGAVVTEWVPSCSLAEVMEGRPSAVAAASAIRPLAHTVCRAHEIGSVLALDDPDRLRVSRDGDVFLAFPGPLPDSDRACDVRGLGVALSTLTTGDRSGAGDLAQLSRVPSRLAELIVRAVEPGAVGADWVAHVLDEVAERSSIRSAATAAW